MDAGAITVPSPVVPTSKAGRPRRSRYRRAPGRPPQHGRAMLTRVLRGVPLDTIDGRSQVGVALRRVREDLVAHLGGDPTAPESILVEEAAKLRVIAAAVGDYILQQQTLVRDGELLPVVLQHAALVSGLAKLLKLLGLRAAAREVTVADELAALHAKAAES